MAVVNERGSTVIRTAWDVTDSDGDVSATFISYIGAVNYRDRLNSSRLYDKRGYYIRKRKVEVSCENHNLSLAW